MKVHALREPMQEPVTLDRRTSPSDLSNARGAILGPRSPRKALRGRPRAVALREVVNAIL